MSITISSIDTYTVIVLNALFTGIGVAIGQPIGKIIWDRVIKRHADVVINEIDVIKSKRKVSIGKVKLSNHGGKQKWKRLKG